MLSGLLPAHRLPHRAGKGSGVRRAHHVTHRPRDVRDEGLAGHRVVRHLRRLLVQRGFMDVVHHANDPGPRLAFRRRWSAHADPFAERALARPVRPRQRARRASANVSTSTGSHEGPPPPAAGTSARPERRYFVAISHADAALTRTSLSSSAIARRAVSTSRGLPASHHRNACVSSRIRTVLSTLPQLQFLLRQRLEEGVGDLDLSLHGAEATFAPGLAAHEPARCCEERGMLSYSGVAATSCIHIALDTRRNATRTRTVR